MSRLLRILLKTGAYLVDQAGEQFSRLPNRISDATAKGKSMVYPKPRHTMRDILGFATGLGLGFGAGILLAPAGGAATRSSIRQTVQEVAGKVREQFAPKDVSTRADSETT